MEKKMRKTFIAIMMLCLLMGTVQSASAAVYTGKKLDGNRGIYVIGNSDFYPFEYYDKKDECFKGIMPELLKSISESTGFDFTYIDTQGRTTEELAKNQQAEMLSAYITDSHKPYVKDHITVLSYEYKGKTVRVGFAFTDSANDAAIESIKEAIEQVPKKEIHGYMLTQTAPKASYIWIWCLLGGALLVFVILALIMRHRIRKQLAANKFTDAETGLGNAGYFEKRFNDISDPARRLYYAVYIMLNEKCFQTYGGETSFSSTVKYTAAMLHSFENQERFAARIAENGFAFSFMAPNKAEAEKMIEHFSDRLSAYIQKWEKSEPAFFRIAAYNLQVSDRNCEILLMNLNQNCMRLIETEDKIVFCDNDMMNSSAEEKQFLESIKRGIDNEEFELYLQFIVDNKTKKIVSAEALSRWDSPEMGLLFPGKYIGEMEKSGDITSFDYYMFEHVCRRLHKWNGTSLGDLAISCNFTRITISEPDFAEKIKAIADKYVFEKAQLVMEITESVIEKNPENAMDNILRCKEMGFRIALDDMGSGYTSLINLCEYPIDIVKIDRDILLRTTEQSGRNLFFGVIKLAHSMGMEAVCEGVETEEQKKLVEDAECDYVQGWYYSRALPVREAEEYALTVREKEESK